MGKLFNVEGPAARGLGKISDLILFSLLWLLCSLPVITVGASTAALYRMMFNLKEDRDTKLVLFFKAFRENFKQGTLLWLTVLAGWAVILGLLLLAFTAATEGIHMVLLAVLAFVFVVCTASSVYLFPLVAYFENTTLGTVKNAVAMGLGHLTRSIPACALTMLPVIALMLSPALFVRLLFLWLALAPGAIAYGVVCILRPVLISYIPDEP